MSFILLVSTGVRLVALAWSLVLLRRIQDWRMGCFTVMLALMVLRQVLTFVVRGDYSFVVVSAQALAELSELLVSIMLCLAIFILQRVLSERKQGEAALRASEAAWRSSEARYRTLVDYSFQGMYIHQDAMIQFANEAMAQTFGYASAHDLRGQDYRQLIPAHEHPRLERYRQALLGGAFSPSSFECQGVKRDGTLIWLECIESLVEWQMRPAVMVIFLDITERKQAEQALRESEERYRVLVEGSVQGIAIISRAGRRLFANQALVTILGYASLEAYLAHHALSNAAAHERDRLRRYREALLCGASCPTHYEYEACRVDGTPLWLERVVTPITWGGELALMSTVLDVTERKRAEEERQRLENQLRQAQKMEALGTLAGGIAHDFNNILGVIIGYTELAQIDVPRGSTAWYNLQEVLTAVRRARDLVQQILTFSRLNETTRYPIQLTALVRETFKLLRASLPTTIDMRLNIATEEATVLADATQMHQTLMNLCANAEYAMRATGGILEIGVDHVHVDDAFAARHAGLQAGLYIRITVRDTGRGMPSEVLERIFDPFYTTKGVGEGTGMGLAIVHGLVTRHEGVITVESTLGKGTTFTIYLPSYNALVRDIEDDQAEMPRGAGRILFVDDEPALTSAIAYLLEMLGYQVTTSTSSRETLDIFSAHASDFDMVMTDQTMPYITGEGLIRELRRIRPDIPIILCTGFSHIMDAEKAQALGIDAFCVKPLEARDLAGILQQVLAKRNGSVARCQQQATE
jgi:PAS domain S-box-containing protein